MDWQSDFLRKLGDGEPARGSSREGSDDSLPERFQLRAVLGTGAQGEVLEAFDWELRRPVALKRARGEGHPSEAYRQRFAREGQALARLRHPGIVRVHEALEDARGRPILVMDRVEGRPLSDWVLSADRVTTARAATVIADLADALAALHAAQIVHRDLKPENVLIREDGSPVLIDFGISHTGGSERLTQTGALLGTPFFMAPEQATGRSSRDPDPRIDIYGLGGILFALLAGRPPFADRHTLQELMIAVASQDPGWGSLGVPPALAAIGSKAMAKDANARYASALELRDALRAHVERSAAKPSAPRSVVAAAALGTAFLASVALGLAIGATTSEDNARRRSQSAQHETPKPLQANPPAPPEFEPQPEEPGPLRAWGPLQRFQLSVPGEQAS